MGTQDALFSHCFHIEIGKRQLAFCGLLAAAGCGIATSAVWAYYHASLPRKLAAASPWFRRRFAISSPHDLALPKRAHAGWLPAPAPPTPGGAAMSIAVDALMLARAQFGFTIAFHIIFPAMSIGLASYLAVLEGAWLITGKPVYLATFRYWLTIFAVVFGVGVVSGLVMSYQFGTNWAGFSYRAGPIIGPLMGYEVLTAFFLESGFLGVMLFGMNRVG